MNVHRSLDREYDRTFEAWLEAFYQTATPAEINRHREAVKRGISRNQCCLRPGGDHRVEA